MSEVTPTRGTSGPRSVTIGRRDSVLVAVASLVSAIVGYAILAIAARILLPREVNTVFVTYWSLLFASFGVLTGMSIETTRAVSAASDRAMSIGPAVRHPRVGVVAATLGVAIAGVLAGTSGLWASRLLPISTAALTGFLAVGVAGFAVHTVIVGSLAGRREWRTYARLILSESLLRLALVAVSVAVGASLLGFALATALAELAWVGFVLVSSRARTAATSRADSGLAVFLRRVGASAVATGSSALLVVGFPVLLSLTTAPEQYKDAAPVLLAISLTRAPLMIPLNAYQGVAVSHFVEHRAQGLRAVLPAARAVVAVGVLGAVLAYAVGKPILELVLGSGYGVSGGVLAGLTLASTFLALLTLTGALCQAMTLHGVFVAGWVSAVVVAVLVLLLPFDVSSRAVLGLSIGPIVGMAVHLAALARPARSVLSTEGPIRRTQGV